MNEQIACALHARNRAIIDAVLARVERLCPGDLDLLAVFGSFAAGNFREDSDLDLLLILRDGAEDRISHCFLMGNTAHDLYTQRWADLEKAVDCVDPFCGKLTDARVICVRDESVRQRWDALGERLQRQLAAPLSPADREAVFSLLDRAAEAFGRMCLAEDFGRRRMWAGCFWQMLAKAVYRLNRACVHHGTGGMPEEMAAFSRLPRDFLSLTGRLCHARTAEELIEVCRILWRNTEEIAALLPADPLPVGTVEEAVSNWRGKITHAARTDDAFLSLMSASSCMYYYEEMHRMFGSPCRTAFSGDTFPAAAEIERQYADALTEYGEYCRMGGCPPVIYADTEELMRRYGRGEE